MLATVRKVDAFTRNILLVFAGSSFVNLANLLYQLLIAHSLDPADFAAVNSLLVVFMLIAMPLSTVQLGVARYAAEFNVRNQKDKIRLMLSEMLKKAFFLAIPTFALMLLFSPLIMKALKIDSISCGYIVAALAASAWFAPVFIGGLQGLELFGWLSLVFIIIGLLKLALAFLFIIFGYGISGALAAFLVSALIGLAIFYFPLRRYISFRPVNDRVGYKEISAYLLPVALSTLFFLVLVNFDMLLVKFFFSRAEAGVYSLTQMVGKIFLFFPAAINIVMFPRISSLKARNMETLLTLKKSLIYVSGLCVFAILFYNLFPVFVLKLLTGKAYPESVLLGRMFSLSMSLFTLLNILIFYFLSVQDLRFIKYLGISCLLQSLAIILFHSSLLQVQLVLCVNSALLLLFFTFMVKRGGLWGPAAGIKEELLSEIQI